MFNPFSGGSNCGHTYTKAEIDTMMAGKADLDGATNLIPTSEIPPEVFERMKVVENDTARFALTVSDVQNGDVVYVNSDQIMYYVYDDTKLNQEAGYKAFASGIAAKAIADKNGNDITETYQPKINSDNKISADNVDDSQSTNKFNVQANWSESNSASPAYINNKPTFGTASALDVPVSGNASTTQVVKGDDSRLTDSRTPTAHNQASDTINAMTGYSKAQADAAIDTLDTLNGAIGKLEYKADVNKTNILSEQAKTTGMSEGGSNYITVGGIRVYVSATAPTGDIPDGSIGVGW